MNEYKGTNKVLLFLELKIKINKILGKKYASKNQTNSSAYNPITSFNSPPIPAPLNSSNHEDFSNSISQVQPTDNVNSNLYDIYEDNEYIDENYLPFDNDEDDFLF